MERETVLSDMEGVKYCLGAGAGVGLFPRLVSSRRGHHMPPLKKKKADVAISVKLTSEGPETCLWHNRSMFWNLNWKGLFHGLF